MNIKHLFGQQRREEIFERIEEVEKKTSAEIVCAVAAESGRYDRAESIVGLICAVLFLVIAQAVPFWRLPVGDWNAPAMSLSWQIPLLILGFIVGSILATYCHPLRRWFTALSERDSETQRAASALFAKVAIGETKSRCGLLIYLSLFERQLVILPDQAVRNTLGDERIRSLCDLAISEIKAGRIERVFETVIKQIDVDLAKHLPAERNLDVNELENHLLIAHRF